MKLREIMMAKKLGGGGDSGPVSKKDVNFYDYDGTLLHSYTVKEAQALTTLPEFPKQKGLICQGWNWSLEDIKAHNCAINIGATYITDDGATRLYIHVGEKNTSVTLTIGLDGTAMIDWGDGTEPVERKASAVNIGCNMSHTYENAGEYTIKIMMDEGRIGFLGNSDGSWILNEGTTSSDANSHYRSMLLKAELGSCVDYFGQYAFCACNSLTSVTIPNGATSISKSAFKDCYSLTSVTIPSGVTSIGDNAISRCYSLTSITIPSSTTSIGISVFRDCCSLTSITIPNGVTSIRSMFSGCYSLTSVTIPNSATSISENAFQYCYSLTSVTIPNGVTSINNYTFYNCYSLTSVTIPNGVTSISSQAFYNCYSLTSVIIPSSVTSISSQAFQNSFGIRYYDFSNHTAIPTLAQINAFSGIRPNCEIRVPAALYDEWIAATNWVSYANNIVAV